MYHIYNMNSFVSSNIRISSFAKLKYVDRQ